MSAVALNEAALHLAKITDPNIKKIERIKSLYHYWLLSRYSLACSTLHIAVKNEIDDEQDQTPHISTPLGYM